MQHVDYLKLDSPLDDANVVAVITAVEQLHLDANVARGIYVPALRGRSLRQLSSRR